eukprot:TRINITY_DN119500_c0_g1_i1.p1 TRINITY_DN119500_c0_g1~~TRINITY_DN119500_c0_g1_i1.p1  ORF type:complete len:293 (-),score=67.87 TRINITY_DN119500_c0_g1_i1:213-971(-)
MALARVRCLSSGRQVASLFSTPSKRSATFDAKAAKYDTPSKEARARFVAEVIRSRPWFEYAPKQTCLDFGAGTGLLTLEMAPSFEHSTGVDISSKMIEVMQTKIDSLGSSSRITATSSPLESLGSFDMIFSLLAFHHVKDVPLLIQQLRQHLNPGGRLLVVDLEASDHVRRFHKPTDNLGEHYEHDGFSEETVRHWFARRCSVKNVASFGVVDFVRHPIRKKLDEGWLKGGPEEEYEDYNLFFASAALQIAA